ncbi:3-hydroxyacyl-CoA dehydrogenase / 3a,7a,12a-trihydroxy-5b-cholest-24-enoyl-CoA hydratase / enoyl-CoA hydratase 2 [Myxococcaceae bacterium]|nr:3-hydroxyacyl-CoA dehydrogenase / 3a,7a,12a-trihydroxy-5b-cholest-24-enoyl-CoA hydratase / enoyl-CoA hydratase 2 [Myxococcaceae bacterium]
MSHELRFDGRVAIVTGAGGGLGRTHALLLASRGARVVVNDLGGGPHGGGASTSAADRVVEEIRAAGGEAVASHHSVTDGDAIVEAAVAAFGTVDIVVNNAGILRDATFQKMSPEDWDLVLRVHLEGTKSVTKATWPILREKGYGRIVMTTSAAGIYGNFGQANYCAAKLGILGLANCLAEEGRSRGIHVNTIAPIAASRLTETVMPAELLAALKPEYVSPLVAWLCHERCDETKGLFEVGAGYVAKLRTERAQGVSFPLGRVFSIEDVSRRWQRIVSFEDAEHPASTADSIQPILRNLDRPARGGNEFVDLDVAARTDLVLESSYDSRDLALYALGVGAARDPLDASERKFVYELDPTFQALPTFGVMPQSSAMLAAAKDGTLSLPGMSFGLDRLLHGEQYMELRGPLPRAAKLRHRFRMKEAYDKDPNAVIVFAISSEDENGEEIVYNEMTAFVKGVGGWGGDRGPSGDVNVPPDREPDAVIEERTDPNQTLLYRLSGDWNPLHADPAFATAFGYEKPILHGLCTFGHCGRHLVRAFCENDGRWLKSIKVRFAKNVYPGETLVTRMWKEDEQRIVFETIVKERGEVVIRNAVAELHRELPKPSDAGAPRARAASNDTLPDESSQAISSEDVFGVVAEYLAAHPELVEKTKAVFQFRLRNPESSWVIDLASPPGSCVRGSVEKPDVTLELDEADIPTVMTGTLADVQKLFFGGKLKVLGNLMASNKLAVLQAIEKERFEAARARRLGKTAATPATGAPAAAAAAPREARAKAIFEALAERLEARASRAGRPGLVIEFRIREPEDRFVVDLSGERPRVAAGEAASPAVIFTLTDEALAKLASGDAEPRSLHQRGELRIDGDVLLARELGWLRS